MDNIIKLPVKMSAKSDDIPFDQGVKSFQECFADGRLEQGKWLMISTTPESQPVLSMNGYTRFELYFMLQAVEAWLMSDQQ